MHLVVNIFTCTEHTSFCLQQLAQKTAEITEAEYDTLETPGGTGRYEVDEDYRPRSILKQSAVSVIPMDYPTKLSPVPEG